MSDMRRYQKYAEKIKLFNGLSAEEVSHILHQGTTVDFRAGDTIFHKGQLGSNLFIVLHGKVNITIDGRMIARCAPGDAFGEMSVLNHRPHTASANAASDVKVFTLNEQQLNQILRRESAVRLLLNVIHMLSSYLENANFVNSKNERLIRELSQQHQETPIG